MYLNNSFEYYCSYTIANFLLENSEKQQQKFHKVNLQYRIFNAHFFSEVSWIKESTDLLSPKYLPTCLSLEDLETKPRAIVVSPENVKVQTLCNFSKCECVSSKSTTTIHSRSLIVSKNHRRVTICLWNVKKSRFKKSGIKRGTARRRYQLKYPTIN